ncbi:hypothetical protein CK203_061696 [Vitis vinifera]|uniref:Uncharacterized protein n=1 Tax=Vitis vinifera TaxID=29760 RepID=A0A438G826_VITVI|nr:hypothetical protein CK203_061696 [Vitis vinifera]
MAIRLGFPVSNNEAEYEAILSGLNLTLALSASKLEICSDSQLVVGHIQGEYEAKDGRMAQYLTKVRDTLNQLNEWVVKRIPRTEKIQVDALAGVAATPSVKEAILLLVHLQSTSSIAITPVCRARKKAQSGCVKLRTTSGQEIYLKIASMHIRMLAELHEGICNNHTGGQSLAHHAHSQGYYWPTMKQDVEGYVKKCTGTKDALAHSTHAIQSSQPNNEPLPFAQVRGTKVKSLKDTWIGQTKCEKVSPYGWPPINKGLLPTTTGKSNPITLRLDSSPQKVFENTVKREPRSSKKTGKDPTLSQRPVRLGLPSEKLDGTPLLHPWNRDGQGRILSHQEEPLGVSPSSLEGRGNVLGDAFFFIQQRNRISTSHPLAFGTPSPAPSSEPRTQQKLLHLLLQLGILPFGF